MKISLRENKGPSSLNEWAEEGREKSSFMNSLLFSDKNWICEVKCVAAKCFGIVTSTAGEGTIFSKNTEINDEWQGLEP